MSSPKFTLPNLPYAYDVNHSPTPITTTANPSTQALTPYISPQIMTLRHSKHPQTYITNLNATLQAQSTATLTEQLHLQPTIRFNAGGHINHTLFWQNLTPASSTTPSPTPSSTPNLHATLQNRWSSIDAFKAKFEEVVLAIQGSGWGWLVQDEESGGLEILTTKDQDTVPRGKKPLLGVDMWEHAYYLQYLNNKKEYVSGIWNVVDWRVVERRLGGSVEGVWGEMGGLAASL